MALMDEEQQVEWWLFLHANPLGVDMGTEELNTRLVSELPENIRRVLWDDKTTARIYVLAKEQQLSDQEISHVARTIRRIMTGELRAASLEQHLSAVLQAPQPKVQQLARKLTEHFISPNYFQIAQVYEKRQKGRTRTDASEHLSPEPPAEPVSPETEPSSSTPTEIPPQPPRVIDLRGRSIPTRLPPPPAIVPPPQAPPASPPPKTPGGGTHGPLPQTGSRR